jgi:Spy/CpxP family protein refolding chaperone
MKTRARAAATSLGVLALVFVSGTLVGRAWDERSADARPAEEVQDTSQDAGVEDREARRRTPMYEQVGLTDAQRVEIDSIVVHYRSDLRELQAHYRELYDAQRVEYGERRGILIDSVRQAIKSVMGPEQRAQYDSLLAASDERQRARREERERAEGNDEGR